jgi:hypothetical protein
MRPTSSTAATLALLGFFTFAAAAANADPHAPEVPEAVPVVGPKNVITVATSGGQFTSVAAALASITNASISNRYLIKVGPGTFVGRVVMKPYVDLEGSGTQLTILSAPGGNNVDSGAVLKAASNSEIRFLWVRSGSGGTTACGIFSTTGIVLTHVLVSAATGTQSTYGVYGFGAYVFINDSEITVNGGNTVGTALYATGASITVRRSVLYAQGVLGAALVTEGSSYAEIVDSELTGSRAGVEGRPGTTTVLNGVSAFGPSTGLACDGCFVLARNTAFASFSNGTAPRHGVRLSGAGARLLAQGGSITGLDATISAQPGAVVYVAGAFVSGGAVTGGGFVKCSGISDENYNFFANTCP